MDAERQSSIDRHMMALDGTPNKGRLGANAILAVSMAWRARRPFPSRLRCIVIWAASRRVCCRFRMMNILNGGAHADNSVDPQEFMIVPYGAEKFSGKRCAGAPRFSTR
jgi:enolase